MLTVRDLKDIIEDYNLSDDTIICIPYKHDDIDSIDIEVNVVRVINIDSNMSENNIERITMSADSNYPVNEFTVKRGRV